MSEANPVHTPVADDRLLPRNTRRSLPIALLRAREAVMSHFRPMLAKYDVTEQQWRVIRVLAEAGTLDASDVADTRGVQPGGAVVDVVRQSVPGGGCKSRCGARFRGPAADAVGRPVASAFKRTSRSG